MENSSTKRAAERNHGFISCNRGSLYKHVAGDAARSGRTGSTVFYFPAARREIETIVYQSRRRFLSQGAALAVVAAAGSRTAHAAEKISFSFQRSSALLLIMRQQGHLAKAFADRGLTIEWNEFTRIVDAMTANAVDFHGDVADAVPVFAQAAGAPLSYYALENDSPHAEAIIVRATSAIRSVADLRGKTVAVSKGSGCHYLLLRALGRAGLQFTDISPVYLEAAGGSAAFESGSVDAWTIWDPYLAIAQNRQPIRVLTDGAGLTGYKRYYMVSAAFAAKHPDLVQLVFDALVKAGSWIRTNPDEAATVLAPFWGGIPASVIKVINSRRSYDVRAVDAAALMEQQALADAFAAAHLVPGQLALKDVAVWHPAR